jgi:hypothetical protein
MVPWAARKCPYCWSWISGGGYWRSVLGLAMLLCFGIGAFAFFNVFRSLHRSSEDFEVYKEQIKIVGIQVSESNAPGNGYTSIVGRIRNDSPVTWDNPYFEVQCFDRDGKLVDTYSHYDAGMVLVPRTDQAFRLSFQPSQAPEKYADYKVFLRHARDAKRWG